ncbi:MAG: hypothetical protein KDA44_19995 [Planctomycetales bacterium]|nr:hypothetical protein [Planctomycetales bacterium]
MATVSPCSAPPLVVACGCASEGVSSAPAGATHAPAPDQAEPTPAERPQPDPADDSARTDAPGNFRSARTPEAAAASPEPIPAPSARYGAAVQPATSVATADDEPTPATVDEDDVVTEAAEQPTVDRYSVAPEPAEVTPPTWSPERPLPTDPIAPEEFGDSEIPAEPELADAPADATASADSDKPAAVESAPPTAADEPIDPIEAYLNGDSDASATSNDAESSASEKPPADDQPADGPTAEAFFGTMDADALLRAAGGLASAAPRTWRTLQTDRRWEARLVAVTADEAVFVQPVGYETRCVLGELSTDDLRFVRQQIAARQWQIAHEQAPADEADGIELAAQ